MITELEGTENRIAVARRDFNQEVNMYNVKVRSFPSNITAKILGFSLIESFKADGEPKKPQRFSLILGNPRSFTCTRVSWALHSSGCFLGTCSFVFAYSSPGAPTGFVNDFAGILSAQTKTELEEGLKNFAAGGNPQIVVATVLTLNGDPIEDYANRLYREWGIGAKEKNNGVLFLIIPADRKDAHRGRVRA